MMMKKVIIHVGQYKTGSTSIQKMMWSAREQLLKHGILYPETFIRDSAHFLISDQLRRSFRLPHEMVDLEPIRKEIEGSSASTTVISCEALSGATVRRFAPDLMNYMWEYLAELFEGFEIRVVFYVRRQDDSVDSRIVQEIKGQSRKSNINFEAFLYKNSSLNFHYFVKELEKVFGEGNVDARLYDRGYLYKSDVRSDFLQYLGIDCDAICVPDDEDNVSPPSILVALYRIINGLGLDEQVCEELKSGLWGELEQKGCVEKAVVIGKDDRRTVMDYYRESNKLFIDECVTPDHKDAFSDVLYREVKDVQSNVYMDGLEVLRFFRRKGFVMAKAV